MTSKIISSVQAKDANEKICKDSYKRS